ncbi:MAG: gluconokinase [Streptosporangiales bacterium]
MPTSPTEQPVVIVMGVSGSGKTTVGEALAARTDWAFIEGDSLHPPANVEKMRSGYPLDDDDRWPWLRRIGAWVDDSGPGGAVITCSALKRKYRDLLSAARPRMFFLHLSGTQERIAERVAHRKHEYMPASLLASQFADLEPLQPDEHGLTVDATRPAEAIIEEVLPRLGVPT